MFRATAASLLVAAALTAAPLSAQQPATVPDAMPNNIPYGPTITAEQAVPLVQAVLAAARSGARDWKLAIAVVDPHGELVYFYKMDDTQFGSITISQNKARGAARLRRPTQVFSDQMASGAAGAFVPTLGPDAVASPGGVPLILNGQMIGAIGCSGASGAQDHVACSAGAAALGR
jgi:glc operon protein GlcG